ncbi:flagellar hook-basal body complex protein FliE [Clostridium sp. A1-XYC3]|uniref:Flagellar hook-basal body complex protein FliE n=1 Tax=Clostridium tanneri TaxID=3037988 RepID=A0ABU4JNU6_9CLOT|nr:flagellar hook-basal body complex protein FliE [Clostridium sp. A1-XYC3]MDW8799664.1 flagellar hook-basal body complex protein FliE [Clostridium sp. A1-XYC3]
MRINEFVPDNRLFEKIGEKEVKNEKTSTSFGEFLKEKLDNVNEKQVNSENTTEKFIKGDEVDIHKVMMDSEEAKMSLELAVQVRNKFVEAYQELSRTQL